MSDHDPNSLREQSRGWPTIPHQVVSDVGLNPFALELLVESYWEAIQRSIDGQGEEVARTPITFGFRGMLVTLDPALGLDARDAAAGKAAAIPKPKVWDANEDGDLWCIEAHVDHDAAIELVREHLIYQVGAEDFASEYEDNLAGAGSRKLWLLSCPCCDESPLLEVAPGTTNAEAITRVGL